MAFIHYGVDVTATTKTRPLTFDHLKSTKTPRRKTIAIPGSDDALEAVENLENALEEATDPEQRTNLEKQLKAARKTVEDSTVHVTVESIGRKRYEDLIAAHPATAKQNAESQAASQQDAPYNTDTFPPALLAECMVEPAITLEQANEIWDEWNSGELLEVFFGAIEVNTQRRQGLGKGFGTTGG